MSLLRSLVGAAALALSATVVGAQTTVTYLGSSTGVSDGVHYVGPFGATLQTPPGAAQSVTMFCIDVLNQVSAGDSWTGVVSSLANPAAALTTTRVTTASDAQAMTRYRTAAWLTSQFGLQTSGEWADIQHAIWNVFTPGQYAANAWDAAGAAAAAGSFAGFDFSNYAVITDVTTLGQQLGGAQEFIVPGVGGGGTGSVVPEPSTYVLMATGMIALTGVARRRRQTVPTS